MAKIYYDQDADLSLVKDRTIGVIGFGSQGHAHGQNLRDSGCKVLIAELPGVEAWQRAEEAGFKVATAAEVAKQADIVVMLVEDQVQRRVYYENIGPAMTAGKMLMFAHGFNIHFNQILPPPEIDVTMVAPKGPGHRVRELFSQGGGVPGLVAVYQDASQTAKQVALAYAKGIGCTRIGVLETTFAEETETDLFGEQVILCGGVTALMKAAFETLVEAGYQPESAYFECMHELKLIVDLIYEGGMNYMRYSVSDTAEYGDYTRGPRVIDEHVRRTMREILEEVQNGGFAREWILENQAGRPSFLALRKQNAEHQVEQVGKELRAMMRGLKEGEAS